MRHSKTRSKALYPSDVYYNIAYVGSVCTYIRTRAAAAVVTGRACDIFIMCTETRAAGAFKDNLNFQLIALRRESGASHVPRSPHIAMHVRTLRPAYHNAYTSSANHGRRKNAAYTPRVRREVAEKNVVAAMHNARAARTRRRRRTQSINARRDIIAWPRLLSLVQRAQDYAVVANALLEMQTRNAVNRGVVPVAVEEKATPFLFRPELSIEWLVR